MAIDLDMSQFYDIFYEESLEGLEAMESGLIELDIDNPDTEAINTIFRAAHSIKGGAGTFGFTDIADFTHVVETLFDEVRGHNRSVSKPLIDIMLESVDFLRNMIAQSKAGTPADDEGVLDLKQRLASLPDEDKGQKQKLEKGQENEGWHVLYRPKDYLLKTGNDPFRINRELGELGKLNVTADISQLPDLADMDPQLCYLGWDITLTGKMSRNDVLEIFEWLEGDCELDINICGERRHQAERRAEPGGKEERREEERREEGGRTAQELTSIRVNIDKVDNLVNMVGELVITQSMLSSFAANSENIDFEKLQHSIEQMERNTQNIQEQTLNIRMLPIDFVFQRLPRLVRDLSQSMGKQVELVFSGNATEVDKNVLEKIGDPLVHLIRNALDHGIEMPSDRLAAGKDVTGTITLRALHEGGNIVIEIKDDGGGLNVDKIRKKAIEKGVVSETDELSDAQYHNLIFQPGFSTVVEVSDVSGRGVGLDVVSNNIIELGGNVDVNSVTGEGSTFTIRLPLTLAIVDGQLIRVGQEVFVIPLLSIMESTMVNPSLVNIVGEKNEVYRYRDEYLPIIRLDHAYGINSAKSCLEEGLLVIVDGGQQVALFVDDIMGQQQVVVKSLKTNFRHVQSLAGATILGDGTVAMIIDVQGLVRHHQREDGEMSAVELR